MIRLLFAALLALSMLGQNPNTAQFGTAIATDQYLLAAKRLSESSLNGSINASTTTVVVSDGTQFLNWQIVRIDSEEMLIQSVSSNTLTIVSGGRGYNGTTAASHTAGAAVRGIITSWHHNQLAAEVKAIETGAPRSRAASSVSSIRSRASRNAAKSVSQASSASVAQSSPRATSRS
jgi:hypothetical protein